MAAPSFVQASTGATDATGAFTFTGVAGTAGNVVILQILIDGTGAISWGTLSATNIEDLAGTDNQWTLIGTYNVGSATVAQQRLYIGRLINASAPTFTASANTSGDDVYGRMYEFANVSTGTTLDAVIEGGPISGLRTDDSNVETLYGSSGTFEYQAFSFLNANASTLGSVSIGLSKASSPSDGIFIELQADSAGSPSGSALATSDTLAGSAITAGSAYIYSFTISASLSANTTYWIVLKRSGARSTSSHYYVVQSNPLASPITTVAKTSDSGVWSTNTNDISFAIGAAGGAGTEVGTSTTVADAGMIVLGRERLVLNFVGINDDNAISAFTGMTGGTWAEAVAEYADSGGTDASVGLQIASDVGILDVLSSVTASYGFGRVTTQQRAAESFTALGNTVTVAVALRIFGSPSDNAVVEIQTDSAGSPSGTVLGSASISAATLTTTSTAYTFDIAATLAANSTYWLVFRRSGSLNDTDYFGVGSGTNIAPGTGKVMDSGVWNSAGTNDMGYLITGRGTIDGGTFAQADGTDGWGTVGFALLPVAAGTAKSGLAVIGP